MSEPRNGLFVQYCAKDFIDGTNNLGPWEELAYRRIVDLIYTSNDKLADDDKKLAWQTKAGSRWKSIKQILINAGKIEIIDGRVTNTRCRAELQKSAEKIAKQSAKGKASAEARKSLKTKDTPPTAVEPRLEPRCQPTTELLNQEEKKETVATATGACGTILQFQKPAEPPSLKSQIWSLGLDYLRPIAGTTDAKLRSRLGGWCKQYGDASVLDAITLSQSQGAVEPMTRIESILRGKSNGRYNPPGKQQGSAAFQAATRYYAGARGPELDLNSDF
jgi:uncharacterized protein YdaU (DUF1376 family)